MRQVGVFTGFLFLFLFVIFSVSAENSNMSVYGERFTHFRNYNGVKHSVSFYVRNNSKNSSIISACFIPHFYNDYGEIFVKNSFKQIEPYCFDKVIIPNQNERFEIIINGYPGAASKVHIETEMVLTIPYRGYGM